MENQHEEAETTIKEVSHMVNAGVGPTSHRFLCSIFTDGAMSRVELFRKRQRLDALLTATPEQLKGMKIEITELKQIFKLCEARFTQTWDRLEPQLSQVEKFVASYINERSMSAPCKFIKNVPDLLRREITMIHEGFRAEEELIAELFQAAPRSALEEKYAVAMIQRLQKCNNLMKSANDKSEQFCSQIKILNL